MFLVLPFGLSTACYVFTKLLRPLVKRWRSQGRRVVVYIDDGICASVNVQEPRKHSAGIQADLRKAGFVLNTIKSRLDPLIKDGQTEMLHPKLATFQQSTYLYNSQCCKEDYVNKPGIRTHIAQGHCMLTWRNFGSKDASTHFLFT